MPETMMFLGNSLLQWLVAAGVFLGTALALRLLSALLLSRMHALAERTATDVDDLIGQLLRKTKTLVILLVALWVAARMLTIPPRLDAAFSRILIVALLLQVGVWAAGLVDYLIDRHRRRQIEVDPGVATAIGAMFFVARTLVWTLVLLVVLDNLGIDVTALITGLGIGGIAVALALQNVLSDLFASLSIVLDKPFVVGDFIIVGEFLGTVEYVGLKTTRIRSLSGEQLVFSNSDLLGSRIRNYKRMQERRAVFTLGVTYDTPLDKLRRIPRIIREAIEAQENTRFDRSHFKSYGAFSLDFETVYYMLVPDYNSYMDTQQLINFEVFRRFHDDDIEFAFPTQTLFLHSAAGPGGGAPPPT